MLAEGDEPVHEPRVRLLCRSYQRSANWLVGFEVRPSGMESGQQQHRDKSEYTRHQRKIKEFAGQTWKSMN
jgi:hypothetical protein